MIIFGKVHPSLPPASTEYGAFIVLPMTWQSLAVTKLSVEVLVIRLHCMPVVVDLSITGYVKELDISMFVIVCATPVANEIFLRPPVV